MQRVLARAVTVEGVDYAEGTSLDAIPEGNRESLIGTGWTRPDATESDQVEQSESSTDGLSPADDDLPTSGDPSPASDEPQQPPEAIDDSPAITTIGLADDVTELLVGAGVTTVNAAKQYRELNGSFRTIKGITKVRDGLINTLLDQ